MTLIYDFSLEKLLPNQRSFSEVWVFVRNWDEMLPHLDVMKPGRIILGSRFPVPPGSFWKHRKIPPVILVGSRSRKLSTRKWMSFLPVLDQVISEEDFAAQYELILDAPPFTGKYAPVPGLSLPGGFQEFLDFFQHFKRARYVLTDHQWEILQRIAHLGDVTSVAEAMDRHPRTIRDQIEKIGIKMKPLDVESFFRKPVAAMIDQVPGWEVREGGKSRDPNRKTGKAS